MCSSPPNAYLIFQDSKETHIGQNKTVIEPHVCESQLPYGRSSASSKYWFWAPRGKRFSPKKSSDFQLRLFCIKLDPTVRVWMKLEPSTNHPPSANMTEVYRRAHNDHICFLSAWNSNLYYWWGLQISKVQKYIRFCPRLGHFRDSWQK